MDEFICCLMGLCCAANSPEQTQKLGRMLIARGVCKEVDESERIAGFLVGLVQQVRDMLKGKS